MDTAPAVYGQGPASRPQHSRGERLKDYSSHQILLPSAQSITANAYNVQKYVTYKMCPLHVFTATQQPEIKDSLRWVQ